LLAIELLYSYSGWTALECARMARCSVHFYNLVLILYHSPSSFLESTTSIVTPQDLGLALHCLFSIYRPCRNHTFTYPYHLNSPQSVTAWNWPNIRANSSSMQWLFGKACVYDEWKHTLQCHTTYARSPHTKRCECFESMSRNETKYEYKDHNEHADEGDDGFFRPWRIWILKRIGVGALSN
jgi:hypothetical protein